MFEYAVLHAHTSKGSVGDSTLSVAEYVARAKELGLSHIAITDHGSMASMIEFHEACKKASITGIIGMEAYVVEDRLRKDPEHRYDYGHLILLARDAEGVRNLLRIHNDAQIDGFYGKPRTDYSVLKKYGSHIIALSACVAGEIPKKILMDDMDGARRIISIYQNCFDQFYLEIQPGHFEEQQKVNDALVSLSHELKIPLAATNDIHYLMRHDAKMHDLHIKSCGSKHSYPDTCYYLMAQDEFEDSFTKTDRLTNSEIHQAIVNTNHIASLCDGNIDYNFEMPKYLNLPDGETEESYLAKLCIEELHKRSCNLKDPAQYEKRLQYELDTITKLGFCGYFLIVKDFLDHARTIDIAVGPGRGSVAGSLVSWLLNISIADPIQNGLLFERFLSADRVSLPDIDLDFSSSRRDEMKDYVIEKYGKEHVALVGTFGIRKAKDALRAAGRMYDIEQETMNRICKAAPFKVKDEDGEDIANPTLTDMLRDSKRFQKMEEEFPDLLKAAIQMESFPKSIGIHAAGIIISPHNILDTIPIRVDRKTGRYVATIDKEYIENLALKYDFLALNSVDTIQKTIQDAGIQIDLNDETFYQDKTVWDSIATNHTVGVFQISSNIYRQRMPRLHPQNIQQMAACLALVRGPCISAKTDELYMDIQNHKKSVVHIDPRYDAVTKDTNGICIYQEQIMKLGTSYGLTSSESYALMKAVAKKKVEITKKLKPKLYAGAEKLGVSSNIVDTIYSIMENASKYSFNASHAVSYGIVSYISAWLKYHYPAEYMANLLTNAYISKKEDKAVEEIVSECRRLKIPFLPLDINQSDWEFKVEDHKIRIGFCALKAFGKPAYQELLDIRPYQDFNQILAAYTRKGTKLNKKTLTVLIFSDACRNMDRQDLLYQMIYEKSTKKQKETNDIVVPEEFSVCAGCTLHLAENQEEIERDLLRANYLWYPGAGLPESGFTDLELNHSFYATVLIQKVRTTTDRRGQKMAFLHLVTKDAEFDGVVFGSDYPKWKTKIHKNKTIIIHALKDKEDGCIIHSIEEK